jgi:plastocyanin
MRKLVLALSVAAVLVAIAAIGAGAQAGQKTAHDVTVPEADRFTPFALTIHAGDTVKWTNNDGDDHTVVSDAAFDTTGHQGTNELLTANGGTLTLRFNHPGTFVYYCRFHAKLDEFNQPIAPGPEGGIQDANGNFGTPMSGVITVLPREND